MKKKSYPTVSFSLEGLIFVILIIATVLFASFGSNYQKATMIGHLKKQLPPNYEVPRGVFHESVKPGKQFQMIASSGDTVATVTDLANTTQYLLFTEVEIENSNFKSYVLDSTFVPAAKDSLWYQSLISELQSAMYYLDTNCTHVYIGGDTDSLKFYLSPRKLIGAELIGIERVLFGYDVYSVADYMSELCVAHCPNSVNCNLDLVDKVMVGKVGFSGYTYHSDSSLFPTMLELIAYSRKGEIPAVAFKRYCKEKIHRGVSGKLTWAIKGHSQWEVLLKGADARLLTIKVKGRKKVKIDLTEDWSEEAGNLILDGRGNPTPKYQSNAWQVFDYPIKSQVDKAMETFMAECPYL